MLGILTAHVRRNTPLVET